MGKLIFILGGAGSGKSRFALAIAKQSSGKIAFVATGNSSDREMKRKIRNHQRERPAHWQTIEAAKTPFNSNGARDKTACLLVDSFTLWISAALVQGQAWDKIIRDCRSFLKTSRVDFARTIIVSDEVGFGIVPANRLAREFREILGIVNQEVAAAADQVFLVAAGLPVQLKADKNSKEKK